MNNRELTNEEIKIIENVINYIFASLGKNISIGRYEEQNRVGGVKFNDFYLNVTIESGKNSIRVYSNRETLALDIWHIADQIREKLGIEKNHPIFKLLWEGDNANYKVIEEYLKNRE